MTVNRQLRGSGDPAAESTYVDEVKEEVEALWRIGVEPLTSVAGTNTITASPLVSGTGFAAYAAGNKFSLIPANANTGAVTINVAGRGAKAVKTAAGNALTGGEMLAGTLYQIEYDGTDFRLAAGGYDLGAGINGATSKTTPVDADEFVLSDSAASNVAKKVTLAELKAIFGGGWTLVDEIEPTSDVASISKTGLSAYRDVKITFAMQTSGPSGTLSIQARSSGGTWRTFFDVGGSSGATLIGELTIANFGRNNNIKIVSGAIYAINNGLVDRSDAVVPAATSANIGIARAVTWSEKWDELRFVPSSGNIEGSTADQRAYAAFYGQGDGD
ncbi:MAG: hypothetical protein CL535_16290 [Ahrensia sp.]|nr:hypothetical protein [Ahrensia sp.]MBV48233.1 hypothetical protein [Roseobacter sp.]|tara:strand:- start:110732 stop:111721 length:990 start_codon:yes stop_codon:yes gene_type:complete